MVVGLAVAVTTLAWILDHSSDLAPSAAAAGATAPAAEPRTLSGVLVTRARNTVEDDNVTTSRHRFLLTAAGDERVVNRPRVDLGEDNAYRVATATETMVQHLRPDRSRYVIHKGQGSGRPDSGPNDHVLRRADAAIVTGLAAAGDPRIEAVRYAGRPAWRLDTPSPINKLGGPGASPDRIEYLVDRETGLPLRVRETLRGRLLQERRVTNLRTGVPAPASAFVLAVPRRPKPERLEFDDRYRRVTLARAAAIAGYAPLVPAALGQGYRRAETSVSRLTGRTGDEAANPVSRNVVSTAYRRGFELVLVSTRCRRTRSPRCARTGGYPRWSDPIGAGESTVVSEQPLRLSEGALAGSRARLVVDPQVTPHVWALTDDLVVTISGPLSGEQLSAAAASLQPLP